MEPVTVMTVDVSRPKGSRYSKIFSVLNAITVSIVLIVCATLALAFGVIRYFPEETSKTEVYQIIAFLECLMYLVIAMLGFATISGKDDWIIIFMVACIFSTMFSLGGLLFNAYTVYDFQARCEGRDVCLLTWILNIFLAIINSTAFITTLYAAFRCCGGIVGEDQQFRQGSRYSNSYSVHAATTISVVLIVCFILALVFGVIRYFPAGASETELYQTIAFLECIMYLIVAVLGFATIVWKNYWIIIFMVSCTFSTMFSLGGLIFNVYTIYDFAARCNGRDVCSLVWTLNIFLAIVNITGFVTTLYAAIRSCGSIVIEDQLSRRSDPNHLNATHTMQTVASITY